MDFHKVTKITMVDESTHTVLGVATAEKEDKSKEICDYRDTSPYYVKWSDEIFKATSGAGQEPSLGNIRLQHGMEIAGKVTKLEFDDAEKQVLLVSTPVSDRIWEMIAKGFITGYSQGGSYIYRHCNECGSDITNGNHCDKCGQDVIVRYAASISEVSYVDNPCLGEAHFLYVKSDGNKELRKFVSAPVTKGGKTKRVAGEDLTAECFAYAGDKDKTETWHYPIKFSTKAKTVSHIHNALAQWNKPSGQKNTPPAKRKEVHAQILAAAKEHGIDVSNKKEKSAMADSPVKKNMYQVSRLAELIQSIKYLQDSCVYEGEQENDPEDFAIAADLGSWMESGIGILHDIVDEETRELVMSAANTKAAKGASMTNEEVSKAAGLGAHFKKSAAHFDKAAGLCGKAAESHANMAEENTAMVEAHKAAKDGAENGDIHKAAMGFHKAQAAHHMAKAKHFTGMAKAYTDMSDHCTKMADSGDMMMAVVSDLVKVAVEAKYEEMSKAVTAFATPLAAVGGGSGVIKGEVVVDAAKFGLGAPSNVATAQPAFDAEALTKAIIAGLSPQLQTMVDASIEKADKKVVPSGIAIVPRDAVNGNVNKALSFEDTGL